MNAMFSKTAAIRSVLTVFVIVFGASAAPAQQILIDQGARVEGLWCFPSAVNPDHFFYLPDEARFTTDERGRPELSYLRYVINEPSEAGKEQGFTQAEGGGILTFLMTYQTSGERVAAAQQALQARTGNKQAELRGPVIFKEGRYGLVSSIIRPDGETERNVLATGNAPVLEGSQLAFSFEVDAERSTLLLRSLEMQNPDVAIVFDMSFEGLTDAFDAKLRVNWDEVQKSNSLSAGADLLIPIPTSVPFLIAPSAKVETAMDELVQSNAVELITSGSDERMEQILDRVYAKLIDLMFEPIEPEQLGALPSRKDLGEVMGNIARTRDEQQKKKQAEPDKDPTSAIGVSVAYKMREIKRTGTTTLDLNHQATVDRHSSIVFGFGNVFKEHGDDTKMFRTVNLADPAFDQREVRVAIDGSILPEFEAYINNVTTTLRKIHGDGSHTLRELVIDRETVADPKKDLRLVYGWKGDANRSAWLDYEYRTRWSFSGGGVYETGWVRASRPMIDLYAPYRRKRIKLITEGAKLAERGFRRAIVQVEYPFFESTEREQAMIDTSSPEKTDAIEITLPLDAESWDYKITLVGPGRRHVSEGKGGPGILFIDAPEANAAGGAD
jgi:hypothetical protein